MRQQHRDVPRQLVGFVNDKVWGTLSMTLIVRDELMAQEAALVERAVDRLHYGTVCLNLWTADAYGLCAGAWGAYPGETLDKVASGIGFVGNALLVHNPEKTVVRSPFRHEAQTTMLPDGTTKRPAATIRAIARYVRTPSNANLMKLIWNLMKNKQSPVGSNRARHLPPHGVVLSSKGSTTGIYTDATSFYRATSCAGMVRAGCKIS